MIGIHINLTLTLELIGLHIRMCFFLHEVHTINAYWSCVD
jgi:hypothetical protein